MTAPEHGVPGTEGPPSLAAQACAVPMVVVILVLGVLGALLVRFAPHWVHYFTFQDFVLLDDGELHMERPDAALARREYWRLLTPAFLHFGIFHILFNALWIWEFGRRIERLTGHGHFLLIFLVTAVSSNIGQQLWQPGVLFGGLSGVVYGLLGYLWFRHRFAPQPLSQLTPGILPLMLIWLLLCLSGMVDWFISGGIANGAHVAGLLIGIAFGAIAGVSAGNRS